MGHITSKDAYKSLEERINWFTQGAPPTESLYKILQVLYTDNEARMVALLPVRPFTAKKVETSPVSSLCFSVINNTPISCYKHIL